MTGKRKPLTDRDGEVRELTDDDFASMVRIDQLPRDHQEALRAVRRRGPQKAPTKQSVTLRLSREVVQHYKATGSGWQTRIDETLRAVITKPRRGVRPARQAAAPARRSKTRRVA